MRAHEKSEDVDNQFLQNYNLLRVEGLRLWFTPDKELNEEEMKLRLAEIVFHNAGFMARLHSLIPKHTEFDKVISNEKVEYMCDVFAVHSIIAKYGEEFLQDNHGPSICIDNLEDCVTQAKSIVE